MMIRKKDNTQPGRSKEQRSSDSTKENANHTEETQHGQSQSPPSIGDGQENGKKLNKRIRWSPEEMKEVLWCCIVMPAGTVLLLCRNHFIGVYCHMLLHSSRVFVTQVMGTLLRTPYAHAGSESRAACGLSLST